MKQFRHGISSGQIRRELENKGVSSEDLRHLDRRIAELDDWFVIEKVTSQQAAHGDNPRLNWEAGHISLGLRFQVLHRARSRCQLCCKSVEIHGITLVVAPKKPLERYASDDSKDFWAICEACDAERTAGLYLAAIAGARPRIKGCRRSVTERENHHEL
jgi:hypothetical protein